jgi:hypothetical protein
VSGRSGGGEGVADYFLVAGGGFCRVQAAGVGEDVHGRLGLAEGPDEVLYVPAGEHGQVCHGLRSGGVVVEHYQDTRGLRVGGGQGAGHQFGGNPDLGRVGGQNVCFMLHGALRCVWIRASDPDVRKL